MTTKTIAICGVDGEPTILAWGTNEDRARAAALTHPDVDASQIALIDVPADFDTENTDVIGRPEFTITKRRNGALLIECPATSGAVQWFPEDA